MDQVKAAFQRLLENKNSYALTIQKYFPDLSVRINRVEQVLELDFYEKEQVPSSLFPFCYALPIFPEKIEEHHIYCHQAMNEKKNQTIQACKSFGMIHLRKWIQENDNGNYILYYQIANTPFSQCREHFLSLETNQKAQEATRSLREQTGLKFSELCPIVNCVYTLKKGNKIGVTKN